MGGSPPASWGRGAGAHRADRGGGPWFDFLNQLRRELPVVQKQAYQLADGTVTDQLTEEQAAKMRQMASVELLQADV